MKKAKLTVAGVAVLGVAVTGGVVASGGEDRPTAPVSAHGQLARQADGQLARQADGQTAARTGKSAGTSKKAGQKCTDTRIARGKRKFAGTWTRWENRDPWTVSGWGPGTLNATTNYTVGHTVTISVGATVESINTVLGYQANKQWTRGLGYTPTMPKKKHYRLDVGRAYKIYEFKVYEPTGEWAIDLSPMGRSQCVGMRDVYVGKGKALWFWKLDHRLSVTPKKKR